MDQASCCNTVVPEWIEHNLPGGDAQPHPPLDHEAGDVEEDDHRHHGGQGAEPRQRGHQQNHVPGRRHLLRGSGGQHHQPGVLITSLNTRA